jgi:hypothetical protein
MIFQALMGLGKTRCVFLVVLLWTDYKQVENYKTRQALLIHQLVLVC